MRLSGLVGDDFRLGRCAGNRQEDAGVAAEGLCSLQQIESRRSFRVRSHVLSDCCQGADLLELDVKSFDLFGETASFPREGGAVGFAIRGKSDAHRAECNTGVKAG
jgi:hypothetical protein